MARALTVQNAEINTASITIRTLQVEGKQVTMGVFRQLAVEDIVNQNPLSLRGIGWGHVNYLIDYQVYAPGDIHLVWQRGNELRRCMVRKSLHQPSYFPKRFELSYLDRWKIKGDDAWEVEKAAQLKLHEAQEAQRLGNYQRALKEFNDRNALVAPLFDLPQLFIAV